MEFYQLRTFLVVAAEKSVTRAARRLYATPPSISSHIKALEDEWNVKLFRRTGTGMEITEKGRELLSKAEATLLAAQDLSNHATDLQDSLLGRVRIGLSCSTDRLQVPRLVERMLAACPGVEAQFDREASQEIIDRLLAEEVDAGFVCGEVPDGFSFQSLPSLDLDVVAPADWHGKLRNAGWAELAALPWIGGGESCPFQMEVDRIFRPKGLQPRYAARSDDENVRMSLVEAGVGLAVFDSLDAARAFGQGRVATWDREKLYCPLSFVHLASRRNDPLVKAVRQSVLEIWPGEARPSCEVIPLLGPSSRAGLLPLGSPARTKHDSNAPFAA